MTVAIPFFDFEFDSYVEAASIPPSRVLLVEDSDDYASLVRAALAKDGSFELDRSRRLDEALRCLERKDYDAMLADLSLPDGQGAYTIECVCALAHDLPVLVLTGSDDPELIQMAFRNGAQDYLVKGQINPKGLPTAIRRAIVRQMTGQ